MGGLLSSRFLIALLALALGAVIGIGPVPKQEGYAGTFAGNFTAYAWGMHGADPAVQVELSGFANHPSACFQIIGDPAANWPFGTVIITDFAIPLPLRKGGSFLNSDFWLHDRGDFNCTKGSYWVDVYFGRWNPNPDPASCACPDLPMNPICYLANANSCSSAVNFGTSFRGYSFCDTSAGDFDGDGWSNRGECIIGTDPHVPCRNNGWPPDVTDDSFVDISDIAAVAGYFGRSVPPEPPRYNIAPDPPDGFIDITDLARQAGLFGRHC